MTGLHSNITEIIGQGNTFSWQDYIIFFIMLTISSIIGLYFGCFGKKQFTADEYLLGGKEMGFIPIAISLVSSTISGISIIAVPADIYENGPIYGLSIFLIPLGIWVSYFITVPVFMKLQFPSTFEYLGVRFDNKVKSLCSFLNTVSLLLYLPIVIYVPTLILTQGTDFNKDYILLVLCGVCVFYTTLGGLKAVVWTDALQFTIMLTSILTCAYLGVDSVGSITKITRISSDGGRLDIDYDFDMTKRDTFWAGVFGIFFTSLVNNSIGQGVIQKYIALPSMTEVRKAIALFSVGVGAFLGMCTFIGFLIYAKYHDCDPVKSSEIARNDQLVPLLVLDVAKGFPGFPGLFIAGVFSAALSTLSGCMNCLSCTVYEDFVAPRMPENISQRKVSYILKLIVLFIGILSFALVYVVERLGGVLELVLSIGGITHGPQLGIFWMGMLVPSSNAKGALYGGVISTGVLLWMVLGNQYYKIRGYFPKETLAISTEGCLTFINSTSNVLNQTVNWQPPSIYKVSHYYYVVLGCLMALIIGTVISKIFKNKDYVVNKDLISPIMHWVLPKTKTRPPENYRTIEQALKDIKKGETN